MIAANGDQIIEWIFTAQGLIMEMMNLGCFLPAHNAAAIVDLQTFGPLRCPFLGLDIVSVALTPFADLHRL